MFMQIGSVFASTERQRIREAMLYFSQVEAEAEVELGIGVGAEVEVGVRCVV